MNKKSGKRLGLVSLLGAILSGCSSIPSSAPQKPVDPEVIFISNYKDPLEHQKRDFYEERIDKNPNDWKARLYFAEELMENALPREAIPHYEAIWQIMHSDKIPQLAYFHLQEAYEVAGRKDDSLRIAKSAVEKWPDDPLVWRHLAQRYDSFGMWKEALNAWNKKKSIKNPALGKLRKFDNNTDGDLLADDIMIAQCYKNLGQYDNALELEDNLIANHPDKPEGYDLRALTYEEMGKYELAINDIKKFQDLTGISEEKDLERIRKKMDDN